MEEVEYYWKWKDISISSEWVGETIKRGTGSWEKEYTYIKIPEGYGYDNYTFLLSNNCVHFSSSGCEWYFSICSDMNIELFYSPEMREVGKKYRRFKLSGEELYNVVFKDYEINFAKESEERIKRERREKEEKDRKKIGRCVCGIYRGNVYRDKNPLYSSEHTFKAFFQLKDGTRFTNKKFKKVDNVTVVYEVCNRINKHDFNRVEDIINAYLIEYQGYYEQTEILRENLKKKEYTRVERKCHPEYGVVTNLDDITKYVLEANERALNDVKIRLQERVRELLGDLM